MAQKQKPVKMLEDSHRAYMQFVNTARLVNESFDITQELVYLFNLGTALLHKRLQRKGLNNYMGVGGLAQTDIKQAQQDQQEAEILYLLDEQFGDIDPRYFKMPKVAFINIIMQNFGVKDKDAINIRKILVMSNFKLKEVRIGKDRFVVHQLWSLQLEQETKEMEKLQKTLSNIQETIKFQKSQGLSDYAIEPLRIKEKRLMEALEAFAE